jgi:hypothetical protein
MRRITSENDLSLGFIENKVIGVKPQTNFGDTGSEALSEDREVIRFEGTEDLSVVGIEMVGEAMR